MMSQSPDVYALPVEAFNQLRQEIMEPTAPMLGVHVLSESIFCGRAAALTLESRNEDAGLDVSAFPRLGGLPTHDVDRIQAKLAQLLREIQIPTAIVAAMLLTLVFFLGVAAYPFALPIAVSTVFVAQWPMQLLREILWLRKRIQTAQLAARKEPDWSKPQIQPIEWWCLIRAGFSSIEKPRMLIDTDAKIQGKPWRVLQRDQFQYPVIVIKSSSERRFEALKAGQLSRQQFARLAAYSYLLTKLERTQSSWAIVLFEGTDEGLAVPIIDDYFEFLKWGLTVGRELITATRKDTGFDPGKPKNDSACAGCHFGCPIRYRPKRFPAVATSTPFLTRGNDGHTYHSVCGDRFGEVPPHLENEPLGLQN